MLTFKNLTGKKESKGEYEEALILGPNPGDVKLTPFVQEKLGVKEGDFAIIVQDEDSGVVYIAKGVAGTPDLDADGKLQHTKMGRVVYKEGEEGFGGVLREASLGSKNLRLTASIGWKAAGGSKEHNSFYKLGEGVEGQVPTAEGSDEMYNTVFFPIILDRRDAKSKKVKEDKVEGIATDATNVSEAVAAEAIQPESTEPEFDAPATDTDFEEEEV